MGRRTVGGGGAVSRRCSLAARWMDAPGAFIVLSLGRHDPRCANSNQLANYEPSRPGPALRRWLLRLMMAGRPQQLHHLILAATYTLEVEAEKKIKFRMSHYTAKHRINGHKKKMTEPSILLCTLRATSLGTCQVHCSLT